MRNSAHIYSQNGGTSEGGDMGTWDLERGKKGENTGTGFIRIHRDMGTLGNEAMGHRDIGTREHRDTGS